MIPIYEKYVKLRDAKGVTDYRVAKDIGLGHSLFNDWKTGRSQPKVDKLMKLANYFDVPITYFIEE